jgi:hypothetical protein
VTGEPAAVRLREHQWVTPRARHRRGP